MTRHRGKIIGGLLGLFFAGPLGAMIGFCIGYRFDKKRRRRTVAVNYAGKGEAVVASSRHSNDAPVSKGLDLPWLQLALLVSVTPDARVSMAPAPDTAVGGNGEVVNTSSRHSDGALAAQRGREACRCVKPRHALAVPE